MHLTFLNPLFLWAVPLAAAPILLHLFFRKRPKPVLFSTLRFLKLASQRAMPRSRLRQRLLLLFRCLMLAFLTLLFARPRIHSGVTSGGAQEEAGAMALLLDASYSMTYQDKGASRFDQAKAAALQSLDTMRDLDRAGVIVYSDRVESSSGFLKTDKKSLAQEISAAEPSQRTTALLPALEAAYGMLAQAASPNKSIVIFSDHASHGWPKPETAGVAGFDPAVKVILVRLGDEGQNAWIERAESSLALGDSPVWTVRARYQGKDSRSRWGVGLYENDQRTAEGFVDLRSGQETAVELRGTGRTQSGRLSLRQDALALDDQWYFVSEEAARISVLVWDGDPGLSPLAAESYYLQQALEEQKDRFQWTSQTGERLTQNLEKFQTLVLCNVPYLDPEDAQKIQAFVQRGGGLLVALGDKVDPDRYRAHAPWLGGVLGSVEENGDTGLTLQADAAFLEDAFSESVPFEWDKISVKRIYRVEPNAAARVLMTTPAGRPLLLEQDEGSGRALLWTSSMDRDWNNLASKPFYPVFVQNALRRLAQGAALSSGGRVSVGEPIRDSSLAGASHAAMAKPDGSSEAVTLLAGGFRYDKTDQAGLYRLSFDRNGSRGEKYYAVNADRKSLEGDLSPAGRDAWNDLLPGASVTDVKAGETFANDLEAALRGREISQAMLGLTLMLALGELLLANPKRRGP